MAKTRKRECDMLLNEILYKYKILYDEYLECVLLSDKDRCKVSSFILQELISFIQEAKEKRCIRVSKFFIKEFERMLKKVKKVLEKVKKNG